MRTSIAAILLFVLFASGKAQIADVLIPAEREREQIIHHKSYSLSYNSSYVLPSWVAYKVVKTQVNKFEKVKEKYQKDPEILTRSSSKSDYKEGGYTMAALASYLDLQNYPEWKDEAFYMSNIVPMKPTFYNLIWSKTEDLIRMWNAGTNGLYVVCGPILADAPFMTTLGDDRLSVPKRYYKVVYDPMNQKAIGFIFTNGAASGKLKSYAMSVDAVEKETGMDFFPSLDNELENKIESQFNINDWNFELIEK
jgi:endonuclease G, mitochondrial